MVARINLEAMLADPAKRSKIVDAFCLPDVEQLSTTTDPVAREIIDAAQRAMDLLDEASIALDDALFTGADRLRLIELSYVAQKARAVADHEVERLCVWAAGKR